LKNISWLYSTKYDTSLSNTFKSTSLSNEFKDRGGIILSSRSSVFASVIIVILVFSGVGSYVFLTSQYVPPDIAVVVLAPGFGDLSMADQVDLGLQELGGDLVVNYNYQTAVNQSDAQEIMEQLASSGIYDLIIAVGNLLAEEIQAVAANHLNQRFAFIGGSVTASNVISASFSLKEAAFLAGALAALMSVGFDDRSGVVGIIGSVESNPVVEELVAGFTQGVIYANNSENLGVTLLPAQYVGSYNDSETARDLAYSMFNPYNPNGNATVIFAPVRASIMGIREAMVLANTTWFDVMPGREPFIIAAEGIQDFMGLPDINISFGYSWVLTSVVPRSDLAVYRIINATMWDDFPTLQEQSPLVYNLENDGVGLTNGFFNPDWENGTVFPIIEDYRALILNGTIIVQETWP
jgi:basic membrane lipoprotein Med (substrate-binding protein (PBP1-ABC) superfamily)